MACKTPPRTSMLVALALCVALHSQIACAAAPANVSSRTFEDCKTTRMILLNNYEFKGLEVYKFSRGTGSALDCSNQCRIDKNCYSFNYVKLTKWCFLGYTHRRYLRFVENGKTASGYRRCTAHSTNQPWTSEVFTVSGAPTSLSILTKTDTSAYIGYAAGTVGNPTETYAARCVGNGLGCTSPAIGTSLSYPRSTTSIPVSGLTANTPYYCYILATNTVGTTCSAALAVRTCAAGTTC